MNSRINEIFDDYSKTSKSQLIIKNIYAVIPDMHMFTELKHLQLINCNLLELPKLPNILTLDISNNKLTQLINIPETLIELNATKNNIATVNLISYINLSVLNLSSNTLHSMVLPPNITELNISNTKFVITNGCTINTLSRLKKLDIEQCLIAQNGLDNLPDELTNISASYLKTINSIIINKLPGKLEHLKCINSNIQEFTFPVFPSSLKQLVIYNNKLRSIPMLTCILDILDVSNNMLLNIPVIPDYVRFFDCSGNNELKLTSEQQQLLKNLDNLPETHITLNEADDNDDNDPFDQFNMSLLNLTQNTQNTQNTRPNIPHHVMRLMNDDGFTPSRRKRLIHHDAVYIM